MQITSPLLLGGRSKNWPRNICFCWGVVRIPALVFGLLIGLLLGICLNFESRFIVQSDVDSHFHSLPTKVNKAELIDSKVWLRCIVLIQPTTDKPQKYLLAIADTYSKQCNETLFFTNSPVLLDKFTDSLNIFLIVDLDPAKWPFLLQVLQFVRQKTAPSTQFVESKEATASPSTQQSSIWTAILNEQTYLAVPNLLALIHQANEHAWQKPVLIGKREQIRSPLSFLFPFKQTQMFAMDSGVVLSKEAIDLIAEDKQCQSTNWLIPKFTGKALLKCGEGIGASIWDPIDEDGHHLFISTSIRTFFSKPSPSLALFRGPLQSIANARESKDSHSKQPVISTDCCSHKAISFGQLSYRDLRLLHFTSANLRVFGI